MRSIGLALVACAMFIEAPSSGADAIAWGTPVDGLRLGISVAVDSPDRTLRVVLQNVSPALQEIVIGYGVGKGVAPSFRFFATTADGREREGFEINSFTPIAGLVIPVTIRLDSGASHELRFGLKKIICIGKPWDITFDVLSRQRCSFHVSLEIDSKSAQWAALSHPWLGKANSAVVSLSE